MNKQTPEPREGSAPVKQDAISRSHSEPQGYVLSRLADPFPLEAVSWRIQGKPYERNGKFSAMALAYIDARDVMDRLDEVCGPENWQCEYVETASGRVVCRIGIMTRSGWVWKSDGAGSTAVEGEKGGISDALKRAAVAWGVGRYLYRLDAPWIACNVKTGADGKPSLFNGNLQWKSWAENPWSKVNVPKFDGMSNAWEDGILDSLPPDPREEAVAEAYAETMMFEMERFNSLNGLRGYFEKHADHLSFVRQHLPKACDALIVAKDKKKEQLSKKKETA